MRLWLAQRFGRGGSKGGTHPAAAGRASGFGMSIGSLEHLVRSRVRVFLRHTWLLTILGTIMVGGLVWAGVHYSTKATMMRIAAGPSGSANAKLVAVLSKVIAQNHSGLQLQLVATDGAAASAQALAKGTTDLAVVPTTVGKSPDWPVIAILRQNVMAFIVPAPAPAPAPAVSAPAPAKSTKAAKPAKSAAPAKSTKTAKSSSKDSNSDDDDDSGSSNKLKKVSQLAGKRVGIVTGNEATTDLLNVVLTHYGVPVDKVQISQIDPANLADAIHKNAVDVLFVAGASTGQAMSDAVTAATQNGVAPSFLEVDQADGIAKRNPAFDSESIDAGTFGGNPPTPSDDLKSLTFAEYLVGRKSFSRSTIAELAKLIYTSRLSVASQMAGEIKITAPSTDKDADALVHQGALDYLNDNQQTFFDKYGDDIFYGMLIFPVFGSAIAGVASYLSASSRTRRLRLLQHVLDLVRKAHAAQSLEAIEQLQVEADNLVIAIVHLSEHEEFDETVRMSFSFALDQLRFAVAARRTAILDHSAMSAGTSTTTVAGSGPSAKAAAA